jgi:uncharacterized protein (DUF608 family)
MMDECACYYQCKPEDGHIKCDYYEKLEKPRLVGTNGGIKVFTQLKQIFGYAFISVVNNDPTNATFTFNFNF